MAEVTHLLAHLGGELSVAAKSVLGRGSAVLLSALGLATVLGWLVDLVGLGGAALLAGLRMEDD